VILHDWRHIRAYYKCISAKLTATVTLRQYPGPPHALIMTAKPEVNDETLAFVKNRSLMAG
jgi:hypothetical protein